MGYIKAHKELNNAGFKVSIKFSTFITVKSRVKEAISILNRNGFDVTKITLCNEGVKLHLMNQDIYNRL